MSELGAETANEKNGAGDDGGSIAENASGTGVFGGAVDDNVVRVAFVASLFVVFAVTAQRGMTRLFVLNFSLSGPNVTSIAALGFVSAWSIPVARRAGFDRVLRAFGAVLPLAVLASAASDPVVALVGSFVAVTAVTPWLVAVGAQESVFVPGLSAGVLGVVGLRTWFGTLPAYATLAGIAIVVSIAVVAAVLAVRLSVPEPGLSAVSWFVCLFQATFFAFPAAVAAWGGLSYPGTTIATVAGVATGALWTTTGPPDSYELGGAVVTFAVVWSNIVFVGLFGPVAVFLAQATLVRIVATGFRDDGTGWLAVAQVGTVLLLFVQVFAANWPFVPGGVLLAGQEPTALFVFGFLPILATFAARPHADTTGGVDPERRSALTAFAPGVLAGPGLVPGALSETTGTDEGPPYRVLTLNVHLWLGGNGAHNYGRIRDLLVGENRPEIVGLQESDGARFTVGSANPVRWLAAELGYHYYYGVPTRRGGIGVALLSRYPIASARVVSLPARQSPQRWALIATVDAPDGPLPVVVTHFQTNFADDPRQLDEARTVFDELPTSDRAVLLGDFNVRPDRRTYEYLAGRFTDAWTADGHDRLGGGYTYPASDPQRRIDYVWLDDSWSVQDVRRVGDGTVSDHLGVLATIAPGSESGQE